MDLYSSEAELRAAAAATKQQEHYKTITIYQ
jgi:hypothetical protein